MTTKPFEEFERFDKAMDKIMTVTKQELATRLKAAKKAKTGKRYPKPPKATKLRLYSFPVSCL